MDRDENFSSAYIHLYHGFQLVLSCDEWKTIQEDSTLITYERNETVIKQGERVHYVVWLEEGFVKLNINVHNRQHLLNVSGPGRFIGMSLMITSSNHSVTITSMTVCRVLLIKVETIRALVKRNGDFAYRIMENSTETMDHYLYNYILLEKRNNMHGRLARILLYFANHVYKADKFNILIRRDELADLILMSRENAIKVLNDFRKDDIITVRGKEIEILDMKKLEDLAEKA